MGVDNSGTSVNKATSPPDISSMTLSQVLIFLEARRKINNGDANKQMM